jgi:hypothetical protein
LWESLKDKIHKTNPHIGRTKKYLLWDFSNFRGWTAKSQHQRVLQVILIEFCQAGNIFSIYCSTGKFLLCFLKVIITAIACHWDSHYLRLMSAESWLRLLVTGLSPWRLRFMHFYICVRLHQLILAGLDHAITIHQQLVYPVLD